MKLSEYLDSLGHTSEEVAGSLRQAGIKGIRVSPCHCPVLNAIYHALPDYWPGLKIYGAPAEAGKAASYHATLSDSQICDPALPRAVIDFIGDFDTGKYPDLEAARVRQVTTREWE